MDPNDMIRISSLSISKNAVATASTRSQLIFQSELKLVGSIV